MNERACALALGIVIVGIRVTGHHGLADALAMTYLVLLTAGLRTFAAATLPASLPANR